MLGLFSIYRISQPNRQGHMKYALLIVIFLFFVTPVSAQNCKVDDFACVMQNLILTAERIDNSTWRDQTYREIAKTLAAHNENDQAMALIARIENPDTKAMTIRGIGMAAAKNNLSKEALDALFAALRAQANLITHPPSYAVALTYIAMAQAFAGDDEGAWKTAAEMENAALRHKAYGETAEIQAEFGKYDKAMKSISLIDAESYRNKAYNVVSKILADGEHRQEALDAANAITNSYKRAQSIQYILDTQMKNKGLDEPEVEEETSAP